MKRTVLVTIAAVIAVMAFLARAEEMRSDIPAPQAPAASALPFKNGEELIYNVYCKNIKVGKSFLTFHGAEVIDGTEVYHITLTTEITMLEDVEEIYDYKDTFLPYRINRTIKRGGYFPTEIEERYDQEAYDIKIKKKGNLFTQNSSIKREGPISNAILLTYLYRAKSDIANIDTYKVILPTTDFDVVMNGTEKLMTCFGERDAYVFKGDPPNFTFWLSADESRIPLKMVSHTIFDYTFILNSVNVDKEG